VESNGTSYFHCQYEFKNGRKCSYKVKSKNGQTTGIAHHLREKHSLKPANKVVQTTLTFENMAEKLKVKTFRETYAELVAKQYLPYSLIGEKVLQDMLVTFHNE
jgi:hypothetical protein